LEGCESGVLPSIVSFLFPFLPLPLPHPQSWLTCLFVAMRRLSLPLPFQSSRSRRYRPHK
jgi:hypothetical protein